MLNTDPCVCELSRQQFWLDKSVINITVIKDDRLMFVHNSKLFLDIQNVYQTDRWNNSEIILGFEPGVFRKYFHNEFHDNCKLQRNFSNVILIVVD